MAEKAEAPRLRRVVELQTMKREQPYDAERDFVRASRLLEAKNYRDALRSLRRASAAGHSAAQVMLGYCFDCGLGVARSRDKALYWYRKAARAGDPAAAANIATVYRDEGRTALAVRWFSRAASKGLPEALLDIAQLQGGPSAEGRLAQATLRRLLRQERLIPSVREEAERLLDQKKKVPVSDKSRK